MRPVAQTNVLARFQATGLLIVRHQYHPNNSGAHAMRRSAIYTQISLATICIMLQDIRGWKWDYFSFLLSRPLLRSCLLWGWLHSCGTPKGYLTNTIQYEMLSGVVKCGMHNPEVTLTGIELALNWNVIPVINGGTLYKLSSLILYTPQEPRWALGISLTIDRWSQGQSESKWVIERIGLVTSDATLSILIIDQQVDRINENLELLKWRIQNKDRLEWILF